MRKRAITKNRTTTICFSAPPEPQGDLGGKFRPGEVAKMRGNDRRCMKMIAFHHSAFLRKILESSWLRRYSAQILSKNENPFISPHFREPGWKSMSPPANASLTEPRQFVKILPIRVATVGSTFVFNLFLPRKNEYPLTYSQTMSFAEPTMETINIG